MHVAWLRSVTRTRNETSAVLLPAEKLSDPQPHLHRIKPGIRRHEPGVRNVHIAQFEGPSPLAEKMQTKRRTRGEVHCRGSRRHTVQSKESPATPFQIGLHISPCGKDPLEPQRINAHSI